MTDPNRNEEGRSSPFLRGCGIAVGIALLLLAFVFGTCFL
jgi:hypothetical protein